jgi:carboxymethylenebutenolidase
MIRISRREMAGVSVCVRPSANLGGGCAAEGYSVLAPNLFYRMARAPVFDESFDYTRNPADREKYGRMVNRKRKIGTHGYCLGGPYVLKTAAALPDRVGAGASFHGGFLVTDKPDSPHLLAPKIKARLYIVIASDDDQREPEVKNQLEAAFGGAKVRAEIEVCAG